MRPKHILLLVILVIVISGGWYAYKMYQEKTPDIVNKKPDVVITATQLIEAFDKDTAAARKQYVDRIIEVTGNVKQIDTTGAIVLGEDDSASVVTVGLDRRHIKDYKKLKQGSEAVIQGICTGSLNDNASSDPTDLLAQLGTTVQLRSAGVKEKK